MIINYITSHSSRSSAAALTSAFCRYEYKNMNIYPQFLIFLFLALFNMSSWSGDGYPGMDYLTGQYDITRKTTIDPPSNEPKNTHFRVYLTGNAAKDLYNNMNVKPVEDVCRDDGSLSKFVGEMQCTNIKNSGKFECFFSIDIANQKIDYGWSC